MDEIKVTHHGGKRMRKRLGINKKGTERLAERALESGVTHPEVKGSLGSYLDAVFLSHRTANN